LQGHCANIADLHSLALSGGEPAEAC